MRAATLFTALSLAASGFAQQHRPPEVHAATIWDAYRAFRQEGDNYVFEITGTDRVGNADVPVNATLYWRASTDPRTNQKSLAQVELDVKRPNNKDFSTRIVGDGANLFRYDLDQGVVSTTTYGFYGDRPPQGYGTTLEYDAPKLQLQLRTATPGLPSYLARLVSELNLAQLSKNAGLPEPVFASWSPGVAPRFFDEIPQDEKSGPRRDNNPSITADDTVTDPITGRSFTRGSDRYVFYGMDQANPARTVAFDLYQPDPDNRPDVWLVRKINLALRSGNRIVDLTITPRAVLPTEIPNWAFRPFAGSDAARFRPANAGG